MSEDLSSKKHGPAHHHEGPQTTSHTVFLGVYGAPGSNPCPPDNHESGPSGSGPTAPPSNGGGPPAGPSSNDMPSEEDVPSNPL